MLLASRIARFARVPASAFDPATLTLTGYWGPDYAGAPWVGRGSFGSSGVNDLVAGTAPAASSGAADFDGVDDYLDGPVLSDIIGAGAYGLHALVYLDTVPADPGNGNRYTLGGIVSDSSAYIGLFPHAGGVTWEIADGIGAASTLTVACGTGAWHRVQVRGNGTTIEMRVDGGSWSSQTYAAIGGLGGTLRVGTEYTAGAAFLDGRVKALLTSDYAPGNTECDDIDGWMVTL